MKTTLRCVALLALNFVVVVVASVSNNIFIVIYPATVSLRQCACVCKETRRVSILPSSLNCVAVAEESIWKKGRRDETRRHAARIGRKTVPFALRCLSSLVLPSRSLALFLSYAFYYVTMTLHLSPSRPLTSSVARRLYKERNQNKKKDVIAFSEKRIENYPTNGRQIGNCTQRTHNVLCLCTVQGRTEREFLCCEIIGPHPLTHTHTHTHTRACTSSCCCCFCLCWKKEKSLSRNGKWNEIITQ